MGIWISGYATEIGFFAYAVAETNNDVKALIGAARAPSGPGSLVPTRNRDLFHWRIKAAANHAVASPAAKRRPGQTRGVGEIRQLDGSNRTRPQSRW